MMHQSYKHQNFVNPFTLCNPRPFVDPSVVYGHGIAVYNEKTCESSPEEASSWVGENLTRILTFDSLC